MTRMVALVLLALTLPAAAWADAISLGNQFGSVSISNSGIVSKGSELQSFNGIVGSKGHSLGSVSFTTGALKSGTIAGGGTFSSARSTFVVIGNGHRGVPKGVIFSGRFVFPITWTLTSQPGNGQLTFQLSGLIEGMLYSGNTVSGSTTQNIYTTAGQLSRGIGHISGGHTGASEGIILTPEPGTLSLLGSGLVGVAGMFRRKRVA